MNGEQNETQTFSTARGAGWHDRFRGTGIGRCIDATPAGEGTTLEEHLEKNRKRAEKSNKPFDEAHSAKWFNAKDVNNDGVIDGQERANKVPADWNK